MAHAGTIGPRSRATAKELGKLRLEHENKPSLQPKIWLVATSVGAGIGLGLLFGPQAGPSRPGSLFPGWEAALIGCVLNLGVAWWVMRSGENPDSVLSSLYRSYPLEGAPPVEVQPKPILWFLAYILFLLSSLAGTIALLSILAVG